jgi:hypothetical protein
MDLAMATTLLRSVEETEFKEQQVLLASLEQTTRLLEQLLLVALGQPQLT